MFGTRYRASGTQELDVSQKVTSQTDKIVNARLSQEFDAVIRGIALRDAAVSNMNLEGLIRYGDASVFFLSGTHQHTSRFFAIPHTNGDWNFRACSTGILD